MDLTASGQMPERPRFPELLPLGSRIRARLQLGPVSTEQLEDYYLTFALAQAGHQQLMKPELIRTHCSQALNNLRVLTTWPPNCSPQRPKKIYPI